MDLFVPRHYVDNSGLMSESHAVFGRQFQIREPGQYAYHRHSGPFPYEIDSGGQELRVTTKFVDDNTPDTGAFRRLQQLDCSYNLGKNAATVNVCHQDDRATCHHGNLEICY